MSFLLLWTLRFHEVPIMNLTDRPSKMSFAYKQIDEIGGHNLDGRLEPGARPQVPRAAGRQVEAHGRLLDGIHSGDAGRVREWVRRHIEDFWRGIRLARLEDRTPVADPRAPTW